MEFSTTPQFFDKDGKVDFQSHADAGFKGIDAHYFLSFKKPYLEFNGKELTKFCKEELAKAKKAGMIIHQLHSFWDWPPQPFDKDEESRNNLLKYYRQAIKGAKLLECKYVAIHHRVPFAFDDPRLNEEAYNSTLDFLKKLMPDCRKYGVTLCLENLPFPQPTYAVEKTVEIIKKVNSKYCGMCFDTGHANITEKSFYDSLYMAKDYIKIFHVHDNDGKGDLHLHPYKGNINWKDFAKVLKMMNYKGMVSSETGITPTGNLPEDIEKLKELKEVFDRIVID